MLHEVASFSFQKFFYRNLKDSVAHNFMCLYDGCNNHKNFQAWFETGVASYYGDTTGGSMTAASSSLSYVGTNSIDALGQENKLESTYLYIQMEYCPR